MRKLIFGLLALGIFLMPAMPASAARVVVGVGVGGCCYGGPRGHYGGYYRGYYGDPYYPAYYYPGYYPYYYYAAPPPPVVVAPAPQVIYATPQSLPANQSSPTYTDNSGRTCREFQSTAKIAGSTQPTYGTACPQPDGSWRVINEQ